MQCPLIVEIVKNGNVSMRARIWELQLSIIYEVLGLLVSTLALLFLLERNIYSKSNPLLKDFDAGSFSSSVIPVRIDALLFVLTSM